MLKSVLQLLFFPGLAFSVSPRPFRFLRGISDDDCKTPPPVGVAATRPWLCLSYAPPKIVGGIAY